MYTVDASLPFVADRTAKFIINVIGMDRLGRELRAARAEGREPVVTPERLVGLLNMVEIGV
jgi:hypothetical protein